MAEEMSDDLDFSNFDGIDQLDWSDVEDELKKNRDMIVDDASGGGGDNPFAGAPQVSGGSSTAIGAKSNIDINFLLDIPLDLTVEVGRQKMLIKELLELDIESVIELQKNIGDPLDVLINDKLVAKGEVIVQNEKFGLRITEIIDENKRLEQLKL